MKPLHCLMAATLLLGLVPGAWAAESISLIRQDRTVVRGMVYRPASLCLGIAMVSPGAGGNEKGYDYLGKALSSMGYLSVVIGHPESSRREVRKHSWDKGLKAGLELLITEPQAYQGRYQDIDVYRRWAQSRCTGTESLLVGHSMGAATVMMQAGASNLMGMTAAAPFNVYIALSPQGSGILFPANAWSGINQPVLMLTGTRDDELDSSGWQSRTEPFRNMTGGCKWLGVIDGATHLNFAGTGLSRKTEALTTQTLRAFLDGLHRGDCRYGTSTPGITVQSK